MKSVRSTVERAARFFHLQSWFRLLCLCVLVGVVSGGGALLFDGSLKLLERLLLENWVYQSGGSIESQWPLLVVPALGGMAAGALALWLAPEATGHGTDAVIRAFHRDNGAIRGRVPLVKGICSVLTIGSGGSAGKEGPIAQIGAGFGSSLATLLKLSIRDRRILMLAGVGGGIGAIFKAPLGGALFAAEVLYRDPDFEHDAVIPCIISSVTAYSVFCALTGYAPVLALTASDGVPLPPLRFPSEHGSPGAELLHYAVLSLLCALVAFLFVKSLKWIEEKCFHALPIPKFSKPALGGLLLGLLALLLVGVFGAENMHPRYIMSGGNSYLQTVVNNAIDPARLPAHVSLTLAGFLAVVVLAKIVATGLTVGSGGSGGLLFPALFLGGLTGAAYAKFCRALSDLGWLHSYFAPTPMARGSMVLVGMGGVFAACTKTPIASLVMVSEITGSYGLVVPLMMTCASAYLLSRSFTMNEAQVPGISDSPAHRGEFLVNVLAEIKVSDALPDLREPEVFTADTPFAKVLERIKSSSATVFPIVDESHCLVGIFSLGDIRKIMNEQAVGSLVVAGDLGTTDVPTVTLSMNLDQALRIFTQRNVDALPVVEQAPSQNVPRSRISSVRRPRGPVGSARVIAMLSRRDVILAYHHRLLAQQHANALESTGSAVFGGVLPTNAPSRLTTEAPGLPRVAKETTRTAAHPEPSMLDEPEE